ncbi:MAG: prepilin-type N-terminal cleavage/methylation domain-containing protein [Candidatus Omnitrophica bacterium]|nr:prepilin-type N-terminal cleavage/methylation domain-containing protein [Candidatus Omnitrophota bacterium]MBU2044676.1 prepilin-type N-terminal cleavage/methylation domain-containing protein [Candidatus Omnitrophota bacterium]MBU2251551.1 prepilin-type N-terminal cleavage/methylation domain-containing protein [Candidatus Omnitrophota bacterium]MBU2474238.1 prepilin-type N-terminal cleavage/methylation domain-containing protein [Candidatus Omnitrophota bacterium]
MRKGFTLLELLIVVIVIGILATIAIPQFLNAVEKARVAKAKSALGLISHAEKMYRAERDTYVAAADGAVDSVLGNYVELKQIDLDQDWDYNVTISGTDNYTATATKNSSSSHGGQSVIYNQDGNCTGNHTLRGPDCGGS